MSAARTLVTSAEVIAELRLALLADLRSRTDDFISVISENARSRQAASTDGYDEPHRRRFREALHAIEVRQQLQETIGWPGQPLSKQALTGTDQCDLAAEILTEYRNAQVARLAHDTVPDSESRELIGRIHLVSTYLRYIRITQRDGVIERLRTLYPFPAR